MSTFDKCYSVFAIIFAITLLYCLTLFPELRQLQYLLVLSFLGLVINVGLMFVVFKDLFTRPAISRNGKIAWTALLLLFWPALLIYLPLHGFRSR